MRAPSPKNLPAGSSGASQVELPAEVVAAATRIHPLLRGLLVVGAGFAQGWTGPSTNARAPRAEATFIFCVKGQGWWAAHGRVSAIRHGDWLVLPPGTTHTCGPQASAPWTVHWARATGALLPDYLRELALGPHTPVLHVGDDPQAVRLFTEMLHSLRRGPAFPSLLHASHALAYLLAWLIQKRSATAPESTATVQRAAQAIIYMSEHLDQPLRVAELARQAGLSATHFGELFKQHTGCSPRDYLHLLRIHHACRLLRDSSLSIKEIAARSGYRDPFHFSRQFKAFQSVSPSDYRQG